MSKKIEENASFASFESGEPHAQNYLRLCNSSAYQVLERQGKYYLYKPPGKDYYKEDVWEFFCSRAEPVCASEIVIKIEYWDEGYGVIRPVIEREMASEQQQITPYQQKNFTRLNSKQYRCAWFCFKNTLLDGTFRLRIQGIQYLRSITCFVGLCSEVFDDASSDEQIHIQPAVQLTTPTDLVCNLPGSSVGTELYDKTDIRRYLREYAPLAKALGFNAIESYVRWNFVEHKEGEFDWSYYDTIVDELQRYGLQWFPLLIVGSAYTLPDWFIQSDEHTGFVCLEHGLSNPIESIWNPYHKRHVQRFLQAFGAHYEPRGCLRGVRLGPSGNYGESQYPAGGNWGFRGQPMHIHIGMWCGDPYARQDFQQYLTKHYSNINTLNMAWNTGFNSFEEICPVLPDQCVSMRQRIDLFNWYTDSMTNWCEWWASEARKAMPNTRIFQSAGGWGAAEIGTDYTGQTRSMLKIKGGIRLTNELDSFHQCFYATRLAATAARLYNVSLGFEPAMGHTARGIAGRLFNCITNKGDHFFTYHANLFHHHLAIASWLSHLKYVDDRVPPLVEIAVYYPQTHNFLSHDAFRFLNAWGFNPYAREIRNQIEVDFLDDRLINEGFLSQYKVLIFVWGEFIEANTLKQIDKWLQSGGIIIFPYFLNMSLSTIEGDTSIFQRWMAGKIGNGKFFRYVGDDEPPSCYGQYVKTILESLSELSEVTKIALTLHKPNRIFVSARPDNALWMLNFTDNIETLFHPRVGSVTLLPYSFQLIRLRN